MARDMSIDPPPYPLNERGYNPAAYTDARDDESNDLLPQQYFSFDYGPKTFHRVMQMLGFFLLVALVAFYFYWHSSGRTHDKIRLEWENLTSSNQCLRYGTREYSATLSVPVGMDPVKECWQKTIDIHGRQILPSRCDTRVVQRTVTGHWIVDFKEPACVTWWRGYDDKGCVEQGTHVCLNPNSYQSFSVQATHINDDFLQRYESVLENLQSGDDWRVMCATTPGRVQGKDFDGPTSCASWRSGINAIWLVEDENCP